MAFDYQKVILSGGAGFIGSNFVRYLLDIGVEVIVIDNFFSGRKEFLPSDVKVIKADIREKSKLEDVFMKFKPELVIHFAAIHFIPYCNSHPEETFDVNVMGTRNVLEASKKVSDNLKILFTSSAAVYPPLNRPLTEDLFGPIDIYGKTKLVCEDLVKLYFRDGIIVRLFNVYGPNDPNPHLIPEILKQLREGNRELRLGNLTPKRDYIHVEDVCKALISLLRKNKSGTYNLGTGKSYSVKEIVEIISQILGEEIKIIQDNSRFRKIERENLVADITKIKNEINWNPEIDIKDGLKKLVTEYLSL